MLLYKKKTIKSNNSSMCKYWFNQLKRCKSISLSTFVFLLIRINTRCSGVQDLVIQVLRNDNSPMVYLFKTWFSKSWKSQTETSWFKSIEHTCSKLEQFFPLAFKTCSSKFYLTSSRPKTIAKNCLTNNQLEVTRWKPIDFMWVKHVFCFEHIPFIRIPLIVRRH